jgi:hypothetical protein
MPATSLALGRLSARADLSGALWLEDERTLVVADLHLEKGSSYAARGVFLPPYDTAATLAALASAVARHAPRRLIALGDSFHDRTASNRLDPTAVAALQALMAGREMVWVTGNHDPDPPAGLGGDVVASLEIGGVTLRHEPDPQAQGPEIAGHLHPVAKIRSRGRSLRRRCFAVGPQRLILPALGAYAGGLNVRDAAFRPLFRDGMHALLIGDGRLYRMSQAVLIGD